MAHTDYSAITQKSTVSNSISTKQSPDSPLLSAPIVLPVSSPSAAPLEFPHPTHSQSLSPYFKPATGASFCGNNRSCTSLAISTSLLITIRCANSFATDAVNRALSKASPVCAVTHCRSRTLFFEYGSSLRFGPNAANPNSRSWPPSGKSNSARCRRSHSRSHFPIGS